MTTTAADRFANIRKMMANIVCTEGEDAGLILLSQDGPTHPEEINGRTVQVYDCNYFSQLGDALIEVFKEAGGFVDSINKTKRNDTMTTDQALTATLAIYGKIQDPLEFVDKVGEAFAKSQMFGCKSVEQGKVLAMICATTGMNPLELLRKFHIILGKLSMRADAMLAGFHERGGKSKILQRTATAAEIELEYCGNTNQFLLTWTEAEVEPWTKDKEGGVKDNYATPRSRMQMLWARVVSDGVRAICPEVVAGTYTPEEIGDLEGMSIEAVEETVKSKTPTTASTTTASTTTSGPTGDGGFATGHQSQQINQLFDQLEIEKDARNEILAKRGVSNGAVRSLTRESAGELLVKLIQKRNDVIGGAEVKASMATAVEVKQIATLFGELGITADDQKAVLGRRGVKFPEELTLVLAEVLIKGLLKKRSDSIVQTAKDDTATSQATAGPATTEQVVKIKASIETAEQTHTPDMASLIGKRLADSGLKKLAQLTFEEARLLQDCLDAKDMNAFFAFAVNGKDEKAPF